MLTKFLPDILERIRGPYTLLALAIFVLIGGFFGRLVVTAESSAERIIYSVLITAIFLVFLLVVRGLSPPIEPVEPHGLGGEVRPAPVEVTEEEIESPERIAGPDRSYSINKPPEGWSAEELSWAEWIRGANQIRGETQGRAADDETSQEQEILSLASDAEMIIVPIPGETLIDGRPFPSALATTVTARLAVLPVDRAQPPLYVERPLPHNLTAVVGLILGSGVITMHQLRSFVAESGQTIMVAELRQELENVVVNGKKEQSVEINSIIIGVEGELRDHLLLLNYPSLVGSTDSHLTHDVEVLRSLVDSFRPLRAVDPDAKMQEYKALADQQFDDLLKTHGEDMFSAEFVVLLMRLQSFDLDNSQERLRAIEMVKPFQAFAERINLEDETAEKLWASVSQAEAGNASEFKLQISQLTALMRDESSGELESDQDALATLPDPE